MSQTSTPLGSPVGTLTNEEIIALTNQINKTVKQYKVILIFAYISIILVMGVIIVPAMYNAIRKQQKKLEAIHRNDLKIYEVKGTLSRKNVGAKATTLYAYKIDGQMIGGEVLGVNDRSGLKEQLGKVVSFQYVPEISKNRLYKAEDGRGFNFITQTRIA